MPKETHECKLSNDLFYGEYPQGFNFNAKLSSAYF